MRSVRSIAITAIVMLFTLAAFASAQTATTSNTPPMSAMKMSNMAPMSDSLKLEHHLGMMKENLSLTDTQVGQIRTILENENKQMMANHDKYSTDTKGMMQARKELRTSTDKDIKAVLTADQVKKYDQMEKQMLTANQKKMMKANETPKTKTEYKQK
jgi:Spy/CpxP family protein refolding chaperone